MEKLNGRLLGQDQWNRNTVFMFIVVSHSGYAALNDEFIVDWYDSAISLRVPTGSAIKLGNIPQKLDLTCFLYM